MVTLQTCPDPKTLEGYLLGKLPADDLQLCESHLSQCQQCVETMRHLEAHDTLDDLARDAWVSAPYADPHSEDAQALRQLIARMRDLGGKPSCGEPELANSTSSQIVEDRAAEVQRWLEPATEPPDLGQLGDYRIQRLLGAGSTGVVYHALDSNLQRPVALKILRPSLGAAARERFVTEARATAAIDHPNVVTIYQVGTKDTLAYLAMQWLPGETLEQRLTQKKTLPVDQVRRMGSQIAAGLAAAHESGLIHRDIKPANIWLDTQRDDAKILDFGLVRITDEDPQLTCSGMIAGTPCFMSPEQSRGADLDARSDLFGLGCLLYQALTGQLPFCSSNALATLQAIQREHPAAPQELDPGIPADLSDLVMCLLEKSPSRRPPDAKAVAQALVADRDDWSFEADYHRGDPETDVKPASTQSRGGRERSRARLAWMSVTLVATMLLASGYFFGQQIIRIATNQGELVIETNDPDVKIEIHQQDELVRILDLQTEQRIDIKAGTYELRPVGDGNSITLSKNRLTLSRGGKEIVTVTRNDRAGASSGSVAAGYTLDANDVLGIFVEGVLGNVGENPPTYFPPPESGLPPAIGFPVLVRDNGEISLPLIDPLPVRGKSVAEVESAIKQAYVDGQLLVSPRVLVSLMRPRDYRPVVQQPPAGDPGSGTGALPSRLPPVDSQYLLDSNDTLGVFIPGVLGGVAENPPVHFPEPGSGDLPSMGYPVLVRSSGELSLPLVGAIVVRGLTIEQAEAAVRSAYTKPEDPLLNDGSGIIVTLMRRRPTRVAPAGANPPESSDPGDSADPWSASDQVALARQRSLDLKADLERLKTVFDAGQATFDELLAVEAEYLTARLGGGISVPEQHQALIRLEEVRAEQFKLAQMNYTGVRSGGASSTPAKRINDMSAARHELRKARKRLHDFAKQNGLPSTQPTYQGKTYEEWLEIALVERDPKTGMEAVEALPALVKDEDRAEMIDAIMAIVRRGPGSAELRKHSRNFFEKLTPQEKIDLAFSELAHGTTDSREVLWAFWGPRPDEIGPLLAEQLNPNAGQLLSLAGKLTGSSREDREFALHFTCSLIGSLDLDLDEFEDSDRLLQDAFLGSGAFQSDSNPQNAIQAYKTIQKSGTVLPGHGERLLEILLSGNGMDRETVNAKFECFSLLSQLPEERGLIMVAAQLDAVLDSFAGNGSYIAGSSNVVFSALSKAEKEAATVLSRLRALDTDRLTLRPGALNGISAAIEKLEATVAAANSDGDG